MTNSHKFYLVAEKFRILRIVFKMAPEGMQTSVEINQLIVKFNGEGKTVREIAELVGRSKFTVHDVINRFHDEFRLANRSREG